MKAFTTVAQESLTQLYRCWLCNSTWQKWNRSKLWTVAFNENCLSQSNYWKYAVHPVLLYLAQTCDFPNGIECSLASSQNGHCMLKKWHATANFYIYIYITVNSDLLLSSIIYHILLVCVLNFQKQNWSDKVLCFLALGSFVVGFLLYVSMKTWSGTGFSLVCNITLPLDHSLTDNSSLILFYF